MENIKSLLFKFLRVDTLIELLSGYLETQVQLFKTEIYTQVSKALAAAFLVIASMLLFCFFLFFFSIGLVHFLNTFFEKTYVGYWIVACLYALPCIVFICFRKKISDALHTFFINQLKQKKIN